MRDVRMKGEYLSQVLESQAGGTPYTRRALMTRLAGAWLAAGLLPACRGGGPSAPTVEPSGTPVLAFFDATPFDRSLSTALQGSAPSTSVHFPARVTLNAIPERFGSWLTMVQSYGGQVDLQPDPHDRTRFVSALLSLAGSAFQALYALVEQELLYGPVRDYNATVYYKKDGQVSQVVFWRKGTALDAPPFLPQQLQEPRGKEGGSPP